MVSLLLGTPRQESNGDLTVVRGFQRLNKKTGVVETLPMVDWTTNFVSAALEDFNASELTPDGQSIAGLWMWNVDPSAVKRGEVPSNVGGFLSLRDEGKNVFLGHSLTEFVSDVHSEKLIGTDIRPIDGVKTVDAGRLAVKFTTYSSKTDSKARTENRAFLTKDGTVLVGRSEEFNKNGDKVRSYTWTARKLERVKHADHASGTFCPIG